MINLSFLLLTCLFTLLMSSFGYSSDSSDEGSFEISDRSDSENNSDESNPLPGDIDEEFPDPNDNVTNDAPTISDYFKREHIEKKESIGSPLQPPPWVDAPSFREGNPNLEGFDLSQSYPPLKYGQAPAPESAKRKNLDDPGLERKNEKRFRKSISPPPQCLNEVPPPIDIHLKNLADLSSGLNCISPLCVPLASLPPRPATAINSVRDGDATMDNIFARQRYDDFKVDEATSELARILMGGVPPAVSDLYEAPQILSSQILSNITPCASTNVSFGIEHRNAEGIPLAQINPDNESLMQALASGIYYVKDAPILNQAIEDCLGDVNLVTEVCTRHFKQPAQTFEDKSPTRNSISPNIGEILYLDLDNISDEKQQNFFLDNETIPAIFRGEIRITETLLPMDKAFNESLKGQSLYETAMLFARHLFDRQFAVRFRRAHFRLPTPEEIISHEEDTGFLTRLESNLEFIKFSDVEPQNVVHERMQEICGPFNFNELPAPERNFPWRMLADRRLGVSCANFSIPNKSPNLGVKDFGGDSALIACLHLMSNISSVAELLEKNCRSNKFFTRELSGCLKSLPELKLPIPRIYTCNSAIPMLRHVIKNTKDDDLKSLNHNNFDFEQVWRIILKALDREEKTYDAFSSIFRFEEASDLKLTFRTVLNLEPGFSFHENINYAATKALGSTRPLAFAISIANNNQPFEFATSFEAAPEAAGLKSTVYDLTGLVFQDESRQNIVVIKKNNQWLLYSGLERIAFSDGDFKQISDAGYLQSKSGPVVPVFLVFEKMGDNAAFSAHQY